jgi:hypothetical protein
MKPLYYWLAATTATFIILLAQLSAYTSFALQGGKIFVAILFLLGVAYLVTLFVFKAKKIYLTKSDLYAALLPPGILFLVVVGLIFIGLVAIG